MVVTIVASINFTIEYDEEIGNYAQIELLGTNEDF